MTTKDDLWVLEWHQESNNIHVQPVSWMTARNFASFRAGQKPPQRYAPIFIGSRKEVEAEAERIRPFLLDREEEAKA